MAEGMDEEATKKVMVQYFFDYIDLLHSRNSRSVHVEPQAGIKYQCPCCRYKTLEERGGFDICPVCFWEDDGQDETDAAINHPFSPNHMSLTQAQENYRRIGACQERLLQFVRPPLNE